MYNKIDFFRKMKYLFHPLRINLYQVSKLKDLAFDIFYLDNRALDGFLEHFPNNGCRLKSCQDCRYCQDFAERAIKVDRALQRKLIDRYEQYLSRVISGDIFKYF